MIRVGDHGERLRQFVPSQFRGPMIDAILAATATEIQRVEDDHYDLWLSSQLGVAVGPLLDQWGALVGEQRSGLDDDDFRVFIEARILVNLTDGKQEDIQRIAEILTAPSTVTIHLYGTYGYQVLIEREERMGAQRAARTARLLRACKPAGFAIDITEQRPADFGFTDLNDGFGVGVFARAL